MYDIVDTGRTRTPDHRVVAIADKTQVGTHPAQLPASGRTVVGFMPAWSTDRL